MEKIRVNKYSADNLRIRTQSNSNSKSKLCIIKKFPDIIVQKIMKQSKTKVQFNILPLLLKKQNSIQRNRTASVFFKARQIKNTLNLNNSKKMKINSHQNKKIYNQLINEQNFLRNIIAENQNQKLITTGKNLNDNELTSYSNNSQKEKQRISITNQLNTKQQQTFQFQQISFIQKNKSRINQLTITKQVEIRIQVSVQKRSFETQTCQNCISKNSIFETIKLQQGMKGFFNRISIKYQNLKKIVEQTQNFKENNKNLIDFVNGSYENDRQKRVFALNKDLQKQQLKIKQIVGQILGLNDQIQNTYQQQNQKRKRINSTTLSIYNLMKTLIVQLNREEPISKDKMKRILQRTLNQFHYFKQQVGKCQDIQKTILEKHHFQVKKLGIMHEKWSKLYYQNRVLLYNFIKQIQKIPAICISLFGMKDEAKEDKCWSEKMEFEGFLKQYMSTKCQECYNLKKKICFLQFTNNKIKTIFKPLQCLIRDYDKKRTSVSFI